MQLNIELIPAKDSDYEILKNIHHITLKSHISKIWGWDEEFQNNYFKENFDEKNIQLIYQTGRVAGYLQSWQSQRKIALVNLLVLPQYQNLGIGTEIIKNLQEEAEKDFKQLELGVFKVNTSAKRLYERLGFKIFDESKTHFLMRYS